MKTLMAYLQNSNADQNACSTYDVKQTYQYVFRK